MSNTTKHTQGPWIISEDGNRICYRNPMTGTSAFLRHDIFRGKFNGEQRANMALIAAAPDLLEALNACLPFMHDLEHDNQEDRSVGLIADKELSEAFHKMKAAIEKATSV